MMIKTVFNYIILFLFISSIQSQLSDIERKNLLEKLFKRNNPDDKNYFLEKDNSNIEEQEKERKYDPEIIKEIIKKYNFPEKYNFIEDINPPVRIKN